MLWQLTGEKVTGVGEASGMFPIDIKTKGFNARMLKQFDELNAEEGFPWEIKQILPTVLTAGESAGHLTEAGARMMDPSNMLQASIHLCPPEGDAGTGMVATTALGRVWAMFQQAPQCLRDECRRGFKSLPLCHMSEVLPYPTLLFWQNLHSP